MPDPREADLPFPLLVVPPGSARAARTPRSLRRLRRASGRHPEWWMLPVSGAAWAWMWVARATAHDAGAGTLALVTMVIAMMLPLSIGQARALSHAVPWHRRHVGAVTFVAAYLAPWIAAMGVIQAVWRLWASSVTPAVAAGVVAGAAALWEITPAKRRLLHGCDDEPPAGSRRRTADAGCAMEGVMAAGSCIASCWALMAACVAFAHSFPAMLVLFGVQVIARWRLAHPAIGAAAVIALWLGLLATGTGGHHAH